MATILHINPSEAAQKSIQHMFGVQHNVVSVADGPTAVQYCAMIQPDLILMDSSSGAIDVQELTQRLKMFMPQTPVLVFVDSARDSGDLKKLGASANGLVQKPIYYRALEQQVTQLLMQNLSPAQPADIAVEHLDDETVAQLEAQITALNQANQRLASLNAISALIGTSLDLEHLTDEILQQIQKTIDFDSATLLLLKGNILEAAASRGLSDYKQGLNIYRKSEHNSAWLTVRNKLPLIINDVTKSQYWEARPELGQVRSWLGVPLIYKDRVVGVLTLDKNQPDAFTDIDARYLFTLAYQIAIAVENAQLFQEWENQATRLKLINEVNHEITTILDVNQLLDALAWAIFERLHYEQVAVFEVDRLHESVVLRAYYDQRQPHSFNSNYQQPLDEGLIGKVIQSRQPLLVGNATDDNIVSFSSVTMRSTLVVPIFVDSQVEAIISIASPVENNFSDQDLWTLGSLAIQTATAIENARLYHNIDAYSDILQGTLAARTQRLQAIKQISQVVSQGLELNELLALVGKSIGQIFTPEGAAAGSVQVSIGLINGSDLTEQIIYSGQADKSNNGLFGRNIYKLDFGAIIGQVIRESKPIILSNTDSKIVYTAHSNAAENAKNSLMLTPLITAGKTIGVITVESKQSDAFDDGDLDTLESVAYQVASAIEHARLLKKTKELAIVDERTRLAREMHDGVAQNLAYILIQVDRCLNMVDEGSKLEAQLEQIGTLLEQNIDELRRNIFDLRPVALEGRSLFEVMENFVSEFGRRWNLKTSCKVVGKTDQVSPEVESSLYRILQETLSNARQHAQCDSVSVQLTVKDNNRIELEIEDNGRGFNPDQRQTQSATRGLGLISMQERAEAVGGQFSISSTSEQGTRVFASLPLG